MKYLFLPAFFTTILLQTSLAQTIWPVTSYHSTPEDFTYLLWTNDAVSRNDTINEKILDLANPMLADSVVQRKKQHHRLFLVGWLIHAFGGYNWRTVSLHKQKLVGTVVGDGRSGEEEYTEYDIKYHLQFHLDKYLHRMFDSYDLQRKYHRQDIRPSHRTNYKVPPFVRDTNHLDSKQYEVGCELTPARCFRAPLHSLFFPTLPDGTGLKQHPNFENDHPSMGVYGVSCLDCNHNCHPEMHPYEWVWWLKANDHDTGTDKTWLVGLFHEGSNRFPNWSKNPKTGTINIPFAFQLTGDTTPWQIRVDHLVFNRFDDARLSQLHVPGQHFGTRHTVQPFVIALDDSTQLKASLRFNFALLTDGLQYWLSDLNYDRTTQTVSGYFHLAVSAVDLYTTRITFTQHYN